MKNSNTYNIKYIHYRDLYGKIIRKDKMTFTRLWGVGNLLVLGGISYKVERVAVAGKIQHVNLVPYPLT